MNTKKLLLLCVATALLVLGTGLGWLFLSPGGVLQENGPEEYMQSLLDSTSAADWEAHIAPVWNKSVSEFEKEEEVFSRIFAETQPGDFAFREYEPVFRRTKPVYILSAGEHDLCLVSLTHSKDGWTIAGIEVPADLLAGETRSLTVHAPAGSEVRVNGVLLTRNYLAEDFVPYEDMQPLESRFDAVPHLERWEVSGLYQNPEVAVSFNGEALPLQSRSGENYRFAPPDARAYSFRFLAPMDAAVEINGALLSEEDRAGELPLPLEVNTTEEQHSSIPIYALYELSGLYSVPEIRVTAADGNSLSPVLWEKEKVYAPLQSTPPEAELAELIETYLTHYCHFGAHHYGYDMLLPYVVERGELWDFHVNAQASLQWIIGEQLDIHEIRSFDWLELGSDLRLCSAHVSCTTTTAYETKDLELDYRLLCVRTEKGWRVQDMAYQ